jgi:sugar phosphate isomerase/epimerase
MAGDKDFDAARDIRRRLSISTYVFYGFRPVSESALSELASQGIRRIELCESPEQFTLSNARSMRRMGETCRACGIQIDAYHANHTHFRDVETEAQRIARVDTCKRQIDTLLELGGKLWACHAGAADATVRASYEELARYIDGLDLSIAVENFGEGTRIADRIAFLDALDHPQVGMILDIGHEQAPDGTFPATVPGGPAAMLRQCGHRLRHLHLYGIVDGRGHCAPFAPGDAVQWVELFQELKAGGYAGDFNFEPAGEPRTRDAIRNTGDAPETLARMAAAALG